VEDWCGRVDMGGGYAGVDMWGGYVSLDMRGWICRRGYVIVDR
jgi:hypothetical protein